MMGSNEVAIKLTEEQREQIRKATGKSISSLLLIKMCCNEPVPRRESSQPGRLTTISST